MSDDMRVVRVRIAASDVVLLGGLLAGEDHLASIQAERQEGERVTVSIVTTSSRAAELDAWLGDLASAIALERVPA
jgi:hypothetical protein